MMAFKAQVHQLMLTQPGRKLLLPHVWQLPLCFLFSGGSSTNAWSWQPVVSVSWCIQALCPLQEAEISRNRWILEPQTSFSEGASVPVAEGIWGAQQDELLREGPRRSPSWILAKESCSHFFLWHEGVSFSFTMFSHASLADGIRQGPRGLSGKEALC